MPIYNPSGRDVQMFISDTSVNSLLRVMLETGYLKLEKELGTSNIDMIYERFTTVYGTEKDTTLIVVEAVEPSPVI